MFSRSRDARGPTRHPFPPHGPSPSSYSLLPLSSSSLAASYSPARKLRPRWALTEGPTESFSPSRAGERRRGLDRAMPDADEDARRVRGHLALADRHRVDGSFCPSLHRSSHPALFSSSATFLRRGARGPPRSFLPHVRLLLPFRMPPRCPRESLTFLLLLLLLRQPRLPLLSPLFAKNPPPRKLTGSTQLIK